MRKVLRGVVNTGRVKTKVGIIGKENMRWKQFTDRNHLVTIGYAIFFTEHR